MKYVEFGKTGEKVSQMCLGTMMFGNRCDQAESARILEAAMDHGVNFVDTAAMYMDGATEEIVGQIIKGSRDRLFLVTKVFKGVDGPSILSGIDDSLRRLQLDYVDLYLIHWPQVGMQPLEMMEALNQVVGQGKARFVGCSNFPAWLFAHSNAISAANGWAPLVANQLPYNLIERGIEVEILPQAVAETAAVMAYRPLMVGVLAGKYPLGGPLPTDSRAQTDARIPVWLERYGPGLARFQQFAAERGLSMAQLAVAWVRHSAGVTAPIVGFSAADQVETAAAGFDFDLTDEDYQEVTNMFDTAVKEEGAGKFPGLRRELHLLGS